MMATQEQTHKMREGPGGGEGGRDTVHWYIYCMVYMNRVLPKWYKEVYSYLSLDCTFTEKGLAPWQIKKSCMKLLILDRLDKYIFCGIISHAGKEFKRGLNHCVQNDFMVVL